MYVDNPMVVYVGSVELNKVHMLEQKCNIYTNKLGAVECLDKYEVACCDEGVLECLDNNNKDNFDGYFIQAHPFKQLLQETLGG